jgi:ATP-dependent Clp protease, protease subunit
MTVNVVYFLCNVNAQTCQDFRGICLRAVHEHKVKELLIHISSTGGSIHEGFTLYHFLRSLPVKVTVTNAGSVESAAVLMYLGGHLRLVSSHARFVFHPWTWGFGEGQRSIPTIKEALHSLEEDLQRFGSIVAEATKGAKAPFDVKATETAANVVDAKEAIAHGIAHEIKESTTPAGAHIWWVYEKT